jgi:hypothetical protein
MDKDYIRTHILGQACNRLPIRFNILSLVTRYNGVIIGIAMTLELVNTTTSLSRIYSREFVGKALELAHSYGWKPMGTRLTILDFQRLWLGTYLTNDGQTVLMEDALSLAEFLSRTLDDIPNENRKIDWSDPKLWHEDDLPEWLSPEEKKLVQDGLEEYWPSGMELHPLEFFAGDEKPYLKEFIRFCRLGSFAVW